MIIKIKDYDGKPRIFSFAESERVKDYLLEKELNTGLLSNRSIIIYPENITLNLSEEETQRFSLCADYDVFQVDSRGNAYKYFNNASLDNAILVIQIALCVRLLNLYEETARIITVMN